MYFIVKRGNEPDRIGRQVQSNSYVFIFSHLFTSRDTKYTIVEYLTRNIKKKIGNHGRSHTQTPTTGSVFCVLPTLLLGIL